MITTGYLFTVAEHPARPIVLKVPCALCGLWRTHGAGTVAEPHHVAGELTERVAHCGNHHYGAIRISRSPFEPHWANRRVGRNFGAFTASYVAFRHGEALTSRRAA